MRPPTSPRLPRRRFLAGAAGLAGLLRFTQGATAQSLNRNSSPDCHTSVQAEPLASRSRTRSDAAVPWTSVPAGIA